MTNWDTYWKSKSLFRRVVEWTREHYFGYIFVNEVELLSEKGNKILEAGCGSGIYLKKLQKKGYDCTGIDNSPASVKLARKNCKKVILGNIKSMPFKDNQFDLCFSQGVLEHFNDKEFVKILKEMHRVANIVVVYVPGSWSIFRIYNPWKDSRFLSYNKLAKLLGEVFYTKWVTHLPSTGFLSIMGVGVKL